MDISTGIVIAVVIFLVLLVGSIWAYLGEKRDYNKGRCPKCFGELRHFDNDSQGGRGYCCNPCNYYIWVSYPFIESANP